MNTTRPGIYAPNERHAHGMAMILCLSGAAVAMKSQANTPLHLKQEFNMNEHISMEYKQRSTYLRVHLQKFCIASFSVLGLKCIKLHRGRERERDRGMGVHTDLHYTRRYICLY